MTRTTIRTIAKLLAGVLVCAQLLVAAYACPRLTGSPAAPPVGVSTADPAIAPAMAAMPDCHGSMRSMDPDQPNLCAEHCKYGQQSDHCASIDVPAALLSPLYATLDAPAAAPRTCVAAWLSALVAASPPHAIAHCVWRI